MTTTISFFIKCVRDKIDTWYVYCPKCRYKFRSAELPDCPKGCLK